MTKQIDRRAQPTAQLALLDRQTWHLWAVSIVITAALAVGIAVLFYPAIAWHTFRLEARLFRVPPQLIVALLTLVILETIYIIGKQRELNELRNYILSISAEAGLLGADAPRDLLTGLFDRRALPDILARETKWVDRYRVPLCLVLFDLREFNKINQKEGNLAGDLVLKDLARVIQSTVRQTDTILRYGPDEFLCLLPRTDLKGAETFSKRVAKACEASARLRHLVLDSGTAVYQAGMDSGVVLVQAEDDLVKGRKLVSHSDAPTSRPAFDST